MKLLVCQPGASWSTHDVYVGLVNGLKQQGHEVHEYWVDQRIVREGAYLDWAYRRVRRQHPDHPRPNASDLLFRACREAIDFALLGDIDWVLIISAMYLHYDVLRALKEAGRKVAILLTESPYDDAAQIPFAALADVVFTNERTSAPLLRQACPNTHYLPHAYDPERHRPDLPDEPNVRAHDVVFVGTGFVERHELFRAIDWSGIDFGLYGSWELIGSRSKLRPYLLDKVIDNRMTASLYRKAKIGLNLHRTSRGFGRDVSHVLGAESLNPRAYELAACGAFHLSDYRPELPELFGDSVPTFDPKRPDELERLIRRYLADDGARAELAAQLPERVRGCTFADRARQVVRALERASNGVGRTPTRSFEAYGALTSA